MVYYFIAVLVIMLDRLVKHLVVAGMYPGESLPVIEDIFHLTYVQNEGAAFSMWQGQWLVLIAFPVVVTGVGLVLMFLKRKTWNKLLLLSIAFICAGGIGNLIDRISIGYVVDIFDFRVFPVFNVADIFICVGCGLMLMEVILFEK